MMIILIQCFSNDFIAQSRAKSASAPIYTGTHPYKETARVIILEDLTDTHTHYSSLAQRLTGTDK